MYVELMFWNLYIKCKVQDLRMKCQNTPKLKFIITIRETECQTKHNWQPWLGIPIIAYMNIYSPLLTDKGSSKSIKSLTAAKPTSSCSYTSLIKNTCGSYSTFHCIQNIGISNVSFWTNRLDFRSTLDLSKKVGFPWILSVIGFQLQ